MTNVSSLSGKFRAYKIAREPTTTKLTRRPRESTVCNQCRTSKLRCDRRRPSCGSCIRKGEAEACIYDQVTGRRLEPNKQYAAEDRLAHLELLVKELMQTTATQQTRDPVQAELLRSNSHGHGEPVDQVNGSAVESADYVGSTHWSAVLDEIDGLKAELTRYTDVDESMTPTLPNTQQVCQELIFGSPQNFSLRQLIRDHLPAKLEADRLLAGYFQGENSIHPFIHAYHFQQQYQQFWSDTSSVNPIWLSLLFSIFHMASTVRARTVSASPESEQTEIGDFRFHIAAGQCLVLGRYNQPQKYVVEALVSYAHCKSMASLDPSREMGAILALAVRSAYQLGYHRDPDFFNSFTPFEAEMRRRTWTVCKQLDLMTSFQLGLPSSICFENCDTKVISNLADTDFGPDSQELPPSRPEDQATPILWFVVKDRQMDSFAKVCRDALSYKEKTQSEIQELDEEIRQMYWKVPNSLRTRPFSESVLDEPFTILTRIYLRFLYLKSLCVLHRRYMARGDPFSTISCLDAAKEIVRQTLEMQREFAPEGRLYTVRWMFGCYTMNDFLLGTTILCIFLDSQLRRDNETANSYIVRDNEALDLLEQAYNTCIEKSTRSKDARRVSQIVRLTLNRVRSPNSIVQNSQPILKPSNADDHGPDYTNVDHSDGIDWHTDSFDLFQPFSPTDDGLVEIDWTMFDPSLLRRTM